MPRTVLSFPSRVLFIAAAVAAWFSAPSHAEENVSLLTADADRYGWQFNNGAEFPGAVGELTIDETTRYGGRPTLKLHGDFTAGGGYVEAGRKLADLDIRELLLTIRNPGFDRFTLRLGDATGQTHQIVVKTTVGDDWQQIVLPLEKFFATRGQADAVTTIAKYESWGGAKDGRWHGPATGIYLLAGKSAEQKIHTLWIADVFVVPRPAAVAGAATRVVLPLSEIADGTHDWTFTNGAEFKGATGSLAVAHDEAPPNVPCLKLAGNFTAGGAYVAMFRRFDEVEMQDVDAFRLRVKTSNAATVSLQLVDGSGQTHQRKGVKLPADGAWHDFAIVPAEIAGGEHWGGANDGAWHGPPKLLQIALTKSSDAAGLQPALLVADVRAEARLPVFRQSTAARFDFQSPDALQNWETEGRVAIVGESTTAQRLQLSRTLEEIDRPCAAVGPTFELTPGRYEIGLSTECDLHSPDNSYRATVELECYDPAGKNLERIVVLEQFGKLPRRVSTKVVELPTATTAGRFVVRLDKTYGRFEVDDLTVTRLAPAPRKDDRVQRLLFATSRLGNLWYPDDPRTVSVRVEAKKPLAGSLLTFEVRDYWGARQAPPATVALVRDSASKGIVYTAELGLNSIALAVGRYYELHASIPLGEAEPFRNFTSFAILPEAENRKYKPEDVPFTARNWDNRITEYIRLTDRLGVRICGLWGGWSSKPPYKPEAPGLPLCRELGMGWLTTTPAKFIEAGKTDYDETALRQGVRDFLQQYGQEKPLVINLGNEPHGTGDKVLRNVAAYKILYDEIKRIDPSITVVATSVEPNEEYFAAGYGQACDAFDFHIYEDAANVRRTIAEYRALQKKYDCVKPIWSTELGLNSQGQTRHAVAVELVKKFTTFFAAGGENVSWFGLLYPDPEAKSYGSSGDSHNVFDCRYNRYAPRLDAVMYYHMVNAIGIKRFVEEQTYDDGIHAFLFRDRNGHCLQVLWKDSGRADVNIALTGVDAVRLIQIDGRDVRLTPADGRVAVSVTSDPILLLYDGGDPNLAAIDASSTTLEVPPIAERGHPIVIRLRQSAEAMDTVDLEAPPLWTFDASPDSSPRNVSYTVVPPAKDATREAEFVVKLRSRGELHSRGELRRRVTIVDPK